MAQNNEEWFASSINIEGPVKFIGDSREDPENDPYFKTWKKAFHEVYSKEENNDDDPCENQEITKPS